MMIMGEYFKAGFMMNAVDQQLPPGREALLPLLKRYTCGKPVPLQDGLCERGPQSTG
jgi:hypothetical protein